MRVDVKELIKLLKFANVHTKGLDKGKKVELISDAMLIGGDGEIRIKACPRSLNIYYDIGIPVNITNEEHIPISDLKEFIKFLNVFNGIIELTSDGDTILVKDASIEAIFKTNNIINAIAGLETTKGKIHYDDLYFGYGTTENYNETVAKVNAKDLAKTIKKVSGSLGIYKLTFSVVDHALYINVRNGCKGDITNFITEIVSGKPASSTYSVGIDHVFNHIEGDVDIYFGNNKPMIVNQDDNLIILFPTKEIKK